MTNKDGLTLYATGSGNWDLYQDAGGWLYSIAKPGTGCGNSVWGSSQHLEALTRKGINHGFTVIKEET